jgi:thiol:disulfide interchange protein
MKESPMSRVLFRTALFVALAIVLGTGAPPAHAQKSESVVKTDVKASKPDDDGNQMVTITLEITDKRYHLYANPVGNDMLKTAQTTVRFTSKLEGDAKVDYPAGKLVKDETVGDYKTYEGTVTIKAKVRRVKGDTSPLALSITFQACDEKTCLLRSTVKLTAE